MSTDLKKTNKTIYQNFIMPYRFLISLIIFTLVCYAPRKLGIDFGSLFSFVLGGIGIIFRIKNNNKNKFFWYEYILFYLVIYSFVLFGVAGFKNWHDNGYYFLKVFRSLCVFYMYYLFYAVLKFNKQDFIKLILCCFGIHFSLVFLQYFPPLNWRLFFLKLNPIYDPNMNPTEFNLYMVGGTRVKGAMMGFDSAGIIIAYVIGLSLLFFKKSYLRIISLGLGFIGVLITSRTGAVVYLGIVTFYFIGLLIKNKKVFLKECLSILTILVFTTLILYTFFSNSSLVKNSIPKTFKFIVNYQTTGHLRDESLDDTLSNHMVISKDDLSLFGHAEHQVPHADGKVTSAGQSDCGYLQLLANFGIPNLFLIIGIHLYLIYKIFIKSIKLFDLRVIILIMFLIACIKGPYFFGRMTYDLIILIFFCEFIDFKENDFNNSRDFLI